jgi:hypothetical protein
LNANTGDTIGRNAVRIAELSDLCAGQRESGIQLPCIRTLRDTRKIKPLIEMICGNQVRIAMKWGDYFPEWVSRNDGREIAERCGCTFPILKE